MELIVAKFGGTSLADEQAIRRSVQLARQQAGLGLLVVSATAGTTDRLVELAQVASKGPGKAQELFNDLELRHRALAQQLSADGATWKRVEQFLAHARKQVQAIAEQGDCSAQAMDALLSVGEGLSSVLVAQVAREVFTERDVEWLDVGGGTQNRRAIW